MRARLARIDQSIDLSTAHGYAGNELAITGDPNKADIARMKFQMAEQRAQVIAEHK